MDSTLLLVLLALAVLWIMKQMQEKKALQSNAEPAEEAGKNYHYAPKKLLTGSEKNFFSTLQQLQQYNLQVFPQVNLATIIEKSGKFRYQNELYRNIDFGIFDRDYNVLLLIELNDPSHFQKDRKARDTKVKDIVKQANLELMTFYTDKPNKPEYVISRILKSLQLESASQAAPAPTAGTASK
ncbi:MAG: DUF2726 domain-containing protein [Erysipelotrichaceae bacterium]|jgi:hypothetical protein|nr:DUF2726 domain-containing protein [Erysipelotrichaceae bacterium]